MDKPAIDRPVRPDDIEVLVAEFEASGCAELHIRFDGFELHLSADASGPAALHQAVPQPAAPSPKAPAAPAPQPSPGSASPAVSGLPGADDLEDFEIVRAPYLGTFYRAPKPGEPSYVELGAKVTAQSEICLVEVMKLFTAVRAGVDGTIARVLAADGQMVEAGQPLFAIDAKG